MREKFSKVAHYADKFVQSDWFIFVNAVIILIGWCFDVWAPMLCVLVALAIIPLFFSKETKHLLSTIMMFTLIISSNRHALNGYAWLLALVPVLFVGIIFSLIRYRRTPYPLYPTKIKGFHCSLIALIIPFALGGAGSPTENVYAVLAALALIVVCALGYSFFTVTNFDSPYKEDLMQYIIKVLFVMGVIICAQMIVFFSRFETVDDVMQACAEKNIDIGWAGPNNVAPILAMAIPATLYLCIRKNKATPLFVIFAVLEYVFILASGSRGTILVVTVFLIPMILYVTAKSQNKLLFGATLSVLFAVALILIALYGDKVSVIISTILNKGLDSSGRFDGLYPQAIDTFKKWPIFGSGWDYKLGGLTSDNYTPYFYHSTALQIMATMGVCGIIAFAFFYFFRYRTFLVLRKNPAALSLLMSTLLFDAYGMADTGFFSPTFFIMLLVITFVAEINLPEDKCRAFGGRNPFKDIAALSKYCVEQIKTKSKRAKKDAAAELLDGPETDETERRENAETEQDSADNAE